MNKDILKKLENSVTYKQLKKERNSLTQKLILIILITYFGFMLSLLFFPEFFSINFVDDGLLTLGFPIAFFTILMTYIIIGIFIRSSNKKFDSLHNEIINEIHEKN